MEDEFFHELFLVVSLSNHGQLFCIRRSSSRQMRPELLFLSRFPGGKPHTLFLKAL
jgi:hypothetical protein